MVAARMIKERYYRLLEILRLEVLENNSSDEFLNYIKNEENKFNNIINNTDKENLREFVRGANRYLDEFVFSDLYYPEIRKSMRELYDILNEQSPI